MDSIAGSTTRVEAKRQRAGGAAALYLALALLAAIPYFLLAVDYETQAVATWRAVDPVALALGGAGGELVGGLWALLVSVVILRTGALARAFGWFGVVIGVVGLVSVAPPLQAAAIAFGTLQIVWFAWLGMILLRTRATAVASSPSTMPTAELVGGQ